MEEQFEFLNKMPNDYTQPYLSLTENSLVTRKSSFVHHYLTNPTEISNNAPTSFRQRLLYMLYFTRYPNKSYVRRCIESKVYNNTALSLRHFHTGTKFQRKKRCKDTHRSPTPNLAQNLFDSEDQYEQFREYMMKGNGILYVRWFKDVGGYVIMNSYHKDHGTAKDDHFEVIRYSKYASEEIAQLDIKCSCDDFKKTAGAGNDIIQECGKISDRNRCMHVRYLYGYHEIFLINVPDSLPHPPMMLSHADQKLATSCLTNTFHEVVLVTTTDQSVFFSVVLHSQAVPVFVVVNKKTHEARCHGTCRNRELHKPKKTAKATSYYLSLALNEMKMNTCQHIQSVATKAATTLHQVLDTPENIKRRNNTFEQPKRKEYFSVSDGKWISASWLKHKPKEKHDPAFTQ